MAGSNSTHAVKRDTILLNGAKGYIGGRLLRHLEDGGYRVRCLASAAREAGVRRIIYLGGLGNGRQLSGHLESRREVGEILQHSGVPTIEFHASTIIGSGSLSFEMIRKPGGETAGPVDAEMGTHLLPTDRGRKLVESLRNETVVVDESVLRSISVIRGCQMRSGRHWTASIMNQLLLPGVDISLVSFQMGF